MNLFILSKNPQKCAEYMMDRHVVKIILEAVQMLCVCKRILDTVSESENNLLYKTTHVNHPVSKWVRESFDNWLWTIELIEAMHNEWKFRYNHDSKKTHKSFLIAMYLKDNPPPLENFTCKGLTEFALAMPNIYKKPCPVESYRLYYAGEKQNIATYTRRQVPEWFTQYQRANGLELLANVV